MYAINLLQIVDMRHRKVPFALFAQPHSHREQFLTTCESQDNATGEIPVETPNIDFALQKSVLKVET